MTISAQPASKMPCIIELDVAKLLGYREIPLNGGHSKLGVVKVGTSKAGGTKPTNKLI